MTKTLWWVAAAFCILTSSTRIYRLSTPQHLDHPPSLAVSIPVFWGTAAFESSMKADAIGANRMDRGLFQLYCAFDAYRMQRWGWFNPMKPEDSARIARLIYADNGAAFHSTAMRVTAFRWGINGAMRHGVDGWYVGHVMKEARAFRR